MSVCASNYMLHMKYEAHANVIVYSCINYNDIMHVLRLGFFWVGQCNGIQYIVVL